MVDHYAVYMVYYLRMKNMMKLPAIALASIVSFYPTAALANSYQNEILREQARQRNELNTQLQIQANQRELENLRSQVAAGNAPAPVVVERGPNPLTVLLGTAIIGAGVYAGLSNRDRYRYNNHHHHYRREYYHNGQRYRRCGPHGHYYC